MPTKRTYNIRVSVFKGSPIDFYKYRHTGLWFVPDDSSSTFYFHVVGSTGNFRFEKREGYDPRGSSKFANGVNVGKAGFSVTSAQLVAMMESVPVRNEDHEFNCKQWVEHALRSLLNIGYITEEQYNCGVDGMIAITMEAVDEDIA